MPSDIVAANQMHDANGNMVVLEDYQGKPATILSQDGSAKMQIRKQRSLVRGSDQLLHGQPDEKISLQKRARRNSLADGQSKG